MSGKQQRKNAARQSERDYYRSRRDSRMFRSELISNHLDSFQVSSSCSLFKFSITLRFCFLRQLRDLQAAHDNFKKAGKEDSVDLWKKTNFKVESDKWPESSYFDRLLGLSMMLCAQGKTRLRKAINRSFDGDNLGRFAFHNDLEMV